MWAIAAMNQRFRLLWDTITITKVPERINNIIMPPKLVLKAITYSIMKLLKGPSTICRIMPILCGSKVMAATSSGQPT